MRLAVQSSERPNLWAMFRRRVQSAMLITEEGHNSNGKDKDRNGDNDKEMAVDGDDSDVELAMKMLDTARVITTNRTENTVYSLETSKILSALTEVSMEKKKRAIRQLGR